MTYRLTIDWQDAGHRPETPEARLTPLSEGPARAAELTAEGLAFEDLAPEGYLLALRYQAEGRIYDSCEFQLDVPDVTRIQLAHTPGGARIEQMGFVNDQGEFVDMLIYGDEKPLLTKALADWPQLEGLSRLITHELLQLPANEARSRLNAALGDLGGVYATLGQLWPYQLKRLMLPAYLAQTTPEWKACLLTLLRNNLMLADDESLLDHLQQAIGLAQQQEVVRQLSEEGDWDSDETPATFLQALAGKRMLG